MNLRTLYYFISPKSRLLVRKIYYFPIDFFELVVGRRNKLIPNKGDIFIGSGDFIKQGNYHVKLLIEYANLKPDHSVLDIGCGIGRAALPLTSYLGENSKYEGFDLVKKGIVWCERNIATKYTNFNFRYIPLSNDLYNITNQKAENFIFPYEDNSFDTVFLFSVFTHMQPMEVQNYLNEISRVLKPEGKCLSTFFIYDDEIECKVSKHKQGFCFPYNKDGFRLMSKKVPSANIAFKEESLFEMLQKSDLELDKKIYGTWSGRGTESLLDFQDILVFSKKKV